MNKYGVDSTYEALRQKMLQYIKTIYLGKNHALRDVCSEQLEEPLCLSQYPYIEANQAYKVEKSGIFNIEKEILSDELKTFYRTMVDNKLGVFENPYVHQVNALKGYFSGEDLLVATGTGSGKTECFMWPIIGKLFEEANSSPKTWKARGVRALMLYPMNALVSDQMGRLRRMVGDQGDVFENIFNEIDARRPQFGMYTGRTSYAGQQDSNEDKKLAKTLEKNLVNCTFEAKKQLKKLGKYPAKKDMKLFVEKLKRGEHLTSPNDAELITRQEMQKYCPDILITNYSMLEYMLIRPIENSIWEETKHWLQMNPANKLLFIIDEAHMYRGSSGGEVALLIRRLMNKLEIGRERVQFILTTASVPSANEEGVQKFASDLSSNSDPNHKFKIVTGTPEELDFETSKEYSAKVFKDIEVDAIAGSFEKRTAEIKKFASVLDIPHDGINFEDDKQVEIWLYSALRKVKPILNMLRKCRGNATKLEELASIAFPNDEKDIALYATTVLLAIAPLAKNSDGNVLFPARLHLMFRGLQGLFMCSNPNCTCKESEELPFGRVYLSQKRDTCDCGGKVFELLNDRSCGSLYFKGYIDASEVGVKYIWSSKGIIYNENMHEVHFYILKRNETFDRKTVTNGQNVRFGWLDSLTGRLYEDDSQANNPNCLHIAYCHPQDQKIWTFDSCPHCGKRHLNITDFVTKGNEPFFNLVSEQLSTQPQTLFGEEEMSHSPNKGRKVLLFSDSRQKAAVLAKDLTRAADEDAMKKALTLAAKRLQEWAEENNKEPGMDLLYPFVVEIACTNGLRFFYGEDEGLLQNHMEVFKEDMEFCQEFEDPFDYVAFAQKAKPIPGLYMQQLLKQICSNYRALADVAFCWVSPCNSVIKRAKFVLKKNNIELSEEEFLALYTAWSIDALTSNYAYGVEGISDELRDDAAGRQNPWGIKNEHEIKKDLKDLLVKKHNFTDEQLRILKECFLLTTGEVEGKHFINPSLVTLKFEPYPNRKWFICPRCGKVAPYTLWGECIHCKKSEARDFTEEDVEGLRFWRDPVLKAIHGDEDTVMTSINAEEHTAQLSHKDELNSKMWSTTEDFEMRFQNVFVDSKHAKPVDVLSCTTTMEVGIDIGSLTAVGLRNIPPMRENYQQRAGRAGRRGASVSTIVTYIDNGPHDSFYFDNPELIISGEPRTPWIDNHNKKIVFRHLNIVTINDYLTSNGVSMDSITVDEFFNTLYEKFLVYLKNKSFSDKEIKRLVPIGLEECAEEYKAGLKTQISHLAEQVKDFPEKYKGDKGEMDSLLDALYKEGIMPTYSFPKDVVGFYIEDPDGKAVIEKPDRSLDMAITEYAPGRTLVVNKRTYKSGGLYSYHAKRSSGKYDNPAKKYLSGASSEYVKTLYLCKNNACQWFSTEAPANGICPFCGEKKIETKSMVKPWGFAPLNGTSIRESEAENERSYAENPSYAATPSDQMNIVAPFNHVKMAKRADQQLLIINKGVNGDGFIICKDCGAAVSSDDLNALSANKIQKPYTNPNNFKKCNHNSMSAYLGTDVRTDMVVFEFALDVDKIDTSYLNGGLWIKQAAVTLAEAMVLCAGRLLDVEFNEIKSGYRIRYGKSFTYLDIFLFDSLSSGAGYCSMVADSAGELLKNTLEFLKSCTCENVCHKCLNHFWNQRVQDTMNRHAAIDVLNWCAYSCLAEPLTNQQNNILVKPIRELFNSDSTQSISVIQEMEKYYVVKGSTKKLLYFYPAMWNKNISFIPANCIAISDLAVKYSLSSVYAQIVEEIGMNNNGTSSAGTMKQTKILTYQDGLDFTDESYHSIWSYVLDDIDEEVNRNKIKELDNCMENGVSYEKPIYSPSVLISGDNNTIHVDLFWKKSKVLVVFDISDENLDILKETDWKVYTINDLPNADEFLSYIKE